MRRREPEYSGSLFFTKSVSYSLQITLKDILWLGYYRSTLYIYLKKKQVCVRKESVSVKRVNYKFRGASF